MIELVPATLAHAEAIDLRPGDAAEIAALGYGKVEGLRRSLERSLWAEAYLVDGEVAALIGLVLTSLLGGAACLWLITGRPVDCHRKTFLRLSRTRLAEVRREWPVLVDHVHAEYAQAIRWLDWLGFTLGPPQPYGRLGAPFRRASIGEPA